MRVYVWGGGGGMFRPCAAAAIGQGHPGFAARRRPQKWVGQWVGQWVEQWVAKFAPDDYEPGGSFLCHGTSPTPPQPQQPEPPQQRRPSCGW